MTDDLAVRARRVVTGHDAEGRSVFVADETLVGPVRELPGVGGDARVSGIEVWGTSMMPVDNTEAALAGQIIGGRSQPASAKGSRTVVRLGNLPPGSISPMHRTETIDYAVLLKGECDLMLDSGQLKRITAGDVVVQRGTNHSWINRGDQPCTWLFILIDAETLEIGGQKLVHAFTAAPDPKDIPPP